MEEGKILECNHCGDEVDYDEPMIGEGCANCQYGCYYPVKESKWINRLFIGVIVVLGIMICVLIFFMIKLIIKIIWE